MKLYAVNILKAKAESEESEMFAELGIDPGDDTPDEWMPAILNLDHVTVFYPATEDKDGPICLEAMGTEMVIDMSAKAMKKLLDAD